MTDMNIAVNMIRVLTNHKLELPNSNSNNLDQSANKFSNKAFAIDQDNLIADEDKKKDKANNISKFGASTIRSQDNNSVDAKEKWDSDHWLTLGLTNGNADLWTWFFTQSQSISLRNDGWTAYICFAMIK